MKASLSVLAVLPSGRDADERRDPGLRQRGILRKDLRSLRDHLHPHRKYPRTHDCAHRLLSLEVDPNQVEALARASTLLEARRTDLHCCLIWEEVRLESQLHPGRLSACKDLELRTENPLKHGH